MKDRFNKKAGEFSLAILIIISVFFFLSAEGGRANTDGIDKKSIVKIYTIRSTPNFFLPWSMKSPSSATGSGCIISGNRILTNAHVVSDQTFIQVRKYGEPNRFRARVLSVAHELDLAILTVDDPGFFEELGSLELGDLPKAQQEVLVYGFPVGGDTLSITKGVISRIEHQLYAHSSSSFLAGQIDAAINPGNSGGPVILNDKIVGVVMQTISNAENIGYMVPTPIIEHFLEDIEDGKYDGMPSIGTLLQSMVNPDLKKKYGLGPDSPGVMVIKVLDGSPAHGKLFPGDVITKIDGHEVDNEGNVEFRPSERTSLSYFIQGHQIGDEIALDILRDGRPASLTLTLERSMKEDRLIQYDLHDVRPTYYIYGGLIFTKLTSNYLKSWGRNWYNSAPKEFVSILGANFPEANGEEVVFIIKVLASDTNIGYHDKSNWVVTEVDGKEIKTLAELVKAVENGSNEGFVEFKNPSGEAIVLDRKKAQTGNQQILKTYQIKADRSADLLGL